MLIYPQDNLHDGQDSRQDGRESQTSKIVDIFLIPPGTQLPLPGSGLYYLKAPWPVESVDIPAAGEDEDEDNVANDATNSNDEQEDPLYIKLKDLCPAVHELIWNIELICTMNWSFHLCW